MLGRFSLFYILFIFCFEFKHFSKRTALCGNIICLVKILSSYQAISTQNIYCLTTSSYIHSILAWNLKENNLRGSFHPSWSSVPRISFHLCLHITFLFTSRGYQELCTYKSLRWRGEGEGGGEGVGGIRHQAPPSSRGGDGDAVAHSLTPDNTLCGGPTFHA